MGAGPTKAWVTRNMRKAEERAKEHTRKTGTPCTARLIRASNGEAAIVYDMQKTDGTKFTLLTIP